MSRRALVIGGALVSALVSRPAHASTPDGGTTMDSEASHPLSLQEVLDSVDEHHPLVRAELASVRAARGDVLKARGAYDPSLRVSGTVIPEGYYDYNHVDAAVTQLTPWLGAELYAGYRHQSGNLPEYFGELETLDRGEVRAGLMVPLWKDRSVDDERAARARTSAQLTGAQASFEQMQLSLWFDAAAAYYAWAAAAEGRRVHRELLELAQQRASQLKSKVESGALAPIAALDNQRALLSRQAKLVQAIRKLEQAALQLSLFWRDDAGQPVVSGKYVPVPLQLPNVREALGGPEAQAKAIDRHPALQRYKALEREAAVALDLADNRVAPRLDLKGEVSHDLGDGDADQQTTLAPTVLRTGVAFEIPLALRSARGARQTARAKLDAVRDKAAFARDKVRMQVENAASAVRRAIEQAEQAQQAATVAAQLAAGERKRFEMGATSLIWVTMREKTAADAQLDAIQAVIDAQLAWANYQLALVKRPGS